ncbi:MAG: hypothetical protein AB1488_07630 [Nitrospirota bacterium]
MDILLIIHLLSVVLWIGGVGFATMVVFPAIQRIENPIAKVQVFLGVEQRFSKLAKIYVIIAGITGLMLFFRRGGLETFVGIYHLMLAFKVIVWLTFFILLFGAEKHLMKILVSQQTAPEKAFRRLSIFHWFMLILSGVAIAFGVTL